MKICIALEASNTDKKKNTYKFKWIQTTGTEKTYYEIPEDKQDISDHHELLALPKVKNILKSIKARGSFRTSVISLTPELKEIYFDAEEDVMFKDEYLQLIYSPAYVRTVFGQESSEPQDTVELPRKSKENKKDFKKIKEDFVLNNFDGKSVSVNLWLEKFETECTRCEVEEDRDRILILRLFMDGIAKEWFDSKLIRLGLDKSFQIWKENCLESFCETSWHKYREAYSFRYIGGSLVDYAFRKENLLLNLRNNFPTDILIDLIVTSLPDILQDRINRSKVTTFEKLLGELRKLESSKKYDNGRNKDNHRMTKSAEQIPSYSQTNRKPIKKEPCSICEKKGFSGRFHLETVCRLRNKSNNVEQKNIPGNIRTVNNVGIQDELNEAISNQKN